MTSTTVILGSGVEGHTAALRLRRRLRRGRHEVIVVSPNPDWSWIPPNISVGVGQMTESAVTFPLAPVYKKVGITFHQARAVALYPEGDGDDCRPVVEIEYTDPEQAGQRARLRYDYLIDATGAVPDLGAAPEPGPQGHTMSACPPGHASNATEEIGLAGRWTRTVRQRLFLHKAKARPLWWMIPG